MLKDKYVLDNRYGDLIQLIKQDGNIYLLDGDLGYMRVGAKWDDFTIEAIDSIANVGFLFTLSENKDVLD